MIKEEMRLWDGRILYKNTISSLLTINHPSPSYNQPSHHLIIISYLDHDNILSYQPSHHIIIISYTWIMITFFPINHLIILLSSHTWIMITFFPYQPSHHLIIIISYLDHDNILSLSTISSSYHHLIPGSW